MIFWEYDAIVQVAIIIVCFVILFTLIDLYNRDKRETVMQERIDCMESRIESLHGRLEALNFQEAEIERLASLPDLESEVIPQNGS